MDIALKQRLVGASVLVALGVIFIPMMLDGPGPNGSTGSRIPDPPDQRFETRRLPVDPDQVRAEDEPDEVDSTPAVNSVPEPRPVPVVTRPLPDNSVDPTTVAPPVESSTEAVEPTRPDPAPSSLPETTTNGRWLLQLGSFGNAANAARLVERLQSLGIPGYQDKVSVGDQTLYRVRAGAWASKDAAVRAGAYIGSQIDGIDVSVRESDGEGQGTAAAATQAGWMVQVGSFGERTNALALRDRLRAGGFSALVESIDQAGATSFRVRVGPAIDRSGAEAVQRRLRDEMGLNGIVVSHP